ncbi:IS1182 family transposase [Ktedonobacteria bacterium brp13]|nr:IS1182 family transposase [Ktedonobacteria bacterium brp13]
MTLQPQNEFSIPEETIRVARAAYPKGTRYMKMRDALGTIYQDQSFTHLFPHNGRPVEAPWRLALITVMQFIEELPDRQAADAVRGHIDWKYALGLDLTDPGFDATVLCEFRTRLVQGGAEALLLEVMLTTFKERGWLKERQQQRTDSTHVLAKVRAINRLMCVGETMRFALNSLAVIASDWLLEHCDPEWLDRYGHRIEEAHLPHQQAERQVLAEVIGRDGATLLTELFASDAPAVLREIPAIEILRRVWIQNYGWEEGQLRWRSNDNVPPATLFINSPYDHEARYGKKRETRWTGYKVHLTETCEEDRPHLITHVATTSAPTTDEQMTETIHEELEQAHLSPRQHFVDTGYITAPILVSSQQQYGIEMIGPRRPDVKWQANSEHGIDVSQFRIDWEHQQATCPEGHTSSSWTPAIDNRTNEVIKIRFSTTDCRSCPRLTSCTTSQSPTPRRLITVHPREQHEALQAARRREQTPAFAKLYARREGIEATISQGVRAFDMRRSRYIGFDKTHLQHVSIAAAINVVRIVAWLEGDLPAPTRVSAFQRLCTAA